MRLILLFIFITVHFAAFAQAGGLLVAESSTEQAHVYLSLIEGEDNHGLSDHDAVSFGDGSVRSHTHSEGESEQTQAHHHHSSFCHIHNCHFMTGAYQVSSHPVRVNTQFARLNDRAVQGPFLDSVFRPPIS